VRSWFFDLGRVAHRLRLNDIWGTASRRLAGLVLNSLLSYIKPDVINIHNLHGAFDCGFSPDFVRVCSLHAPTVWTLHDMWSFTGRCAYAYECRKFITGCDKTCPTPTEYPALPPGRIAANWKARRRIFSRLPSVVAVSPSHWLAGEANLGFWASHEVQVIPNGLDLEVYVPLNRETARQALGIEGDAPVLMISAESFADRRKGMGVLLEALKTVAETRVTLITLGHQPPQLQIENIRLYHLGYIDHERTKVLAYNAADVLVHPALADNLPNVVVESIACGTPVIAFPVGGLPEIVRPGQSGWLSEEVSPSALAAAIAQAIRDLQDGRDLRLSCRALAKSEFGLELQASRYSELFERLAIR